MDSTKYLVDSCGTTIELTGNKITAFDCYMKAVGPDVKLYKLSNGNLTLLHRRIEGLGTGMKAPVDLDPAPVA